MNAIIDGLSALFEPIALLCFVIGLGLGLLVGIFPGITISMAVALATSFTLTLEPAQGLAMLLAIYVSAQYGDRIPSILLNTPGTPAAVATTLDGYPMAKKGQAGLALSISAIATTVGILMSMIVLMFFAQPIAQFALNFGPFEMFALVSFGLTVIISISTQSLAKGIFAGLLGITFGMVGLDPITGDPRFVFGTNELTSGLHFIAIIIGLFGITEVLDQILTYRRDKTHVITSLGRWWPTKSEMRQVAKPMALSGALGALIGVIPAAGGDIAGLIGWNRAKAISKKPEEFGKGSIEGLVGSDTASASTLGGALTTTLSLGIPGDSVMAVMIGSMIIWGIQPGPSLFERRPDIVVIIIAVMLLATLASTIISLVRTRAMTRLLDLPPQLIWGIIIVFCIVGTYSTTNNILTVIQMLVFGLLGLLLRRIGVPAGPVVLGFLLGPLAESNLRRAMLIGPPTEFITRPISLILLICTVAGLVWPTIARQLKQHKAAL
ncbi:tripartite tricarboxylate transporter permease [Schaalia sp. ZJ405]|uniref:tripartite tricarboxylate transporter permease n=1 Tax=Schaalia sp. ZJ405 TaxID=2709403 RepID=UPI0013EC97F9|nr:tripartite tricarboxylate transporter permease [Schaalia sp. ZJ405]QPK81960.1 tripartite tricarboxylate transporter permease [Schaalia sp. ZJ405]